VKYDTNVCYTNTVLNDGFWVEFISELIQWTSADTFTLFDRYRSLAAHAQ